MKREKGRELVKRKTATKITRSMVFFLLGSSITQQIYHQMVTGTKKRLDVTKMLGPRRKDFFSSSNQKSKNQRKQTITFYGNISMKEFWKSQLCFLSDWT